MDVKAALGMRNGRQVRYGTVEVTAGVNRSTDASHYGEARETGTLKGIHHHLRRSMKKKFLGI